MREQALILKYSEQYTENKPYHIKYHKAKNKDAVFRKYETQLILYDGAKNRLEQMGLNPVKVNPEEVRKDYMAMENERDTPGKEQNEQKSKIHTTFKKNFKKQ